MLGVSIEIQIGAIGVQSFVISPQLDLGYPAVQETAEDTPCLGDCH